jgi:acetylornithine deacetylase/succinyl-diaminopimelate desuccinylase-like protein
MPTQFDKALDYYQAHAEDLFSQFKEFLRLPSIYTNPAHTEDVLDAADFLVNKIKRIGFENIRAFPTGRHPIVFGEKMVDPQKPTILLYGHYDVQPPDPVD